MAVSILVIRHLVEVCERAGVPRERFLAAAGLDPQRLEAPDGRLSMQEHDALHELALDLTGDAALGLRAGEGADLPAYSLVGNLVALAPTLRHAIEELVRFHRLIVDRPAWKLVEEADRATLLYEVAPGSLRCRRFRAEKVLTGFNRLVQYFGRGTPPRAVCFEYPAPEYAAEYARVFA